MATASPSSSASADPRDANRLRGDGAKNPHLSPIVSASSTNYTMHAFGASDLGLTEHA